MAHGPRKGAIFGFRQVQAEWDAASPTAGRLALVPLVMQVVIQTHQKVPQSCPCGKSTRFTTCLVIRRRKKACTRSSASWVL